MENRNKIFDAIKALAIWLVVLGHCVQYISGRDYWNDGLFQFIYSFHMPLFFMVSGFFFVSSMKLSIWDFLQKKCLTLLLPCFVWGIVTASVHYQSLTGFAKAILLPTNWPFWFFKGLFLVQLVAYLSMRIAERIGGGERIQLCSAILTSLVVYIMPYMGVARVMIPVFWIGYILMMYYEQYIRYHRAIGLVAFAIFVGLYYFWNSEAMHYSASASVTLYHVLLGKHGYTMVDILWMLYRIALGAVGSLVVISAMHELKQVHKFISIIGASTAGIYILQTFIVQDGMCRVFDKYIDLSNWSLWTNYGLMYAISIISTLLIAWIYQLMSKNQYVDLLLFGGGQLTRINSNV